MPMRTNLDIARANFTRRAEIQGELRQIDEAATTDKRGYSDEENGRIEELRGELKAVDDRITANLEIATRSEEQADALSRFGAVLAGRDGEVEDQRSLGQRYVESDAFRSFDGHGKAVMTAEMSLRAVGNVTLGATSGGALVVPDRLARIGRDRLDRRVFLQDLLPHIPVTTGTAEYVQDTTPAANMDDVVAETAETAAKPQADITLGVESESTPTIPAWVNITRQTAQDAPQVQAYIDTRLRYSLRRRVDNQLIAGDGTGVNLKGFANRSGIVTNAPAGAEAWYKTIRHAVTLGEQNEAVYEIVVLNPADAEVLDLSNDTTAGLHAVLGIAGDSAKTTWGMQQVRSNGVAAGTALLIDPMAAAVLDRMEIAAYLTDSHASNFTSNILTLLLETRVGAALFDPKGVAKVTFNAGT